MEVQQGSSFDDEDRETGRGTRCRPTHVVAKHCHVTALDPPCDGGGQTKRATSAQCITVEYEELTLHTKWKQSMYRCKQTNLVTASSIQQRRICTEVVEHR